MKWLKKQKSAPAPGNAASLPGNAASLPGNAASLPGNAASLPGNAASLPGMPVMPPLNAFIELIAFFAVVLLFDAGLQFFPDLNEIKPHPFWLPVLLLSLQYGTVSGLLAAGVSIMVTIVLGWPEQDVGENHFNFLIRVWAEPVLWIIVALLLGQFRIRQIAERRVLLRRINRLYAQRDAIDQHSTNLRGRCDMLERQIAGQQATSPRAILDAIAELDGVDADRLQSAFSKSMQLAFGPGQYSVFVLQNGEFKLIAYHGWEGDLAWRRRFTGDEPLTQRLLHDDAGITILRKSDVEVLNGHGFAAVPIVGVAGGQVVGMLKVEYTEPDQLDKAMLDRLNVIATQLASVVMAHSGATPLAAQSNTSAFAPRRGRKTNWRHMQWDARTSKHLLEEQIGPQGDDAGQANRNAPPRLETASSQNTRDDETGAKPAVRALKKPKVVR